MTIYLETLSFCFLFEYKVKFLFIRPNFTVVTPGNPIKGSVTTELHLNFKRGTRPSQKD